VIFLVGGTRPNFMKLAPISHALEKRNQEYFLVHTNQHYDDMMSGIFFRQLNLKTPDVIFKRPPSTHARMTSYIMNQFEDLCLINKPSLVIVVGDVNSTLACSLVVSKMKHIKLAHVEAGARSFDMTMPEEVNRIISDVVSDYLFTISPEHSENLINEGISKSKIFLSGDVMIDSLLYHADLNVEKKNHILITLHRQENVDNKNKLEDILKAFDYIAKTQKLFFPMHPRTKNRIKEFNLEKYLEKIIVLSPLGYLEFIKMMNEASIVLTDSGSIQVETTVLNIPCLTMRENTERVFTIKEGTNMLVGSETNDIINGVNKYLEVPPHSSLSQAHQKLFDGNASKRIINILLNEAC